MAIDFPAPAPAPDQGGDQGGGGDTGGGGDQGGGGGGFDYGGGPGNTDAGGGAGGPISIGDPGIGDPITSVPDPGSTGEGDQPPPEPSPAPEPQPEPDQGPIGGGTQEPAPIGDVGTGTTGTGTTIDTTTGIDTTIGGIGITIIPPPIDLPIPEPTPPDQPPEDGQPPQPPELPPIGFPPLPPGIVGTPITSPAPAPPIQTGGPTQVTVTPPGRGQTTTQITLQPTPVSLTPVIVNVIEPQPDAAGPPQVQPIQITGGPLEVVLPGLERITAELQGTLSAMATNLTAIGQRISDDIHTEITSLMPAEIDAMNLQADHLGAIAMSLGEMFGSETNLQAALFDLVSASWTQVQPQLDQLLSTSVGDGILNAITGMAATGGGKVSDLLDQMPGGACVSALLKGFLAPLVVEGLLSDGLAVIFGLADVLRVFIDASLAGPVELIKQDSLACAVPSLLSPAEVNESLLRGLIETPYAREQLHRAGFDETRQTVLLGLARRLLERGDILQLWLRGTVSDQERDGLLAQLGYTDTERPGLIELANLLPTPTDLIQWMLRDLFPAPIADVEFDADGNATFSESSEPIDFVKAFGMDLEFPQGSLELFKKLGISEEFAHRYWQAHWELPSPSQGAEMFQRGFITEQAFTRLLRARGVEPYWRKPYREIIYHPITRVDIRRIHKMGLLDHAGLVSRYRQIGYSPDDAELLAQFTEQLNTTTDVAGKLGEYATLKSEIEGLYLDGSIDANTATEHLVQLGYPRDHVTAFIAGAALKREANLEKQVITAVKQLYITLHWDKPTAAAALSREGLTDEHISRLFESWDIDRDYRELTAEEKAHKEATKGEILEGFGDGLISGTTATDMLKALHYSDNDIALLLSLENIKVAKQNAAGLIESVHQRFLAGTIDRAGAVAELDAGAINHVRREGLLARWQLEVDKKSARLTVGQIQQLTTAKLIAPDDAAAELRREGYSAHDAELLLKLFGVTATATTTREAAAAGRVAAAEHRQTAHGLTAAQIEATFKDGVLSETGARDYLRELGYRQQPIDELIKQWRPGP